ncbi:MAG: hypothetical protein A2148_05755 [Chloroflexi bacterium RBG_16_68_14]|nr:MAG: hypothetical protein A2148_05755 [Chloroflexi bacterium RBG_16_68_14]
MEPRIQYAQSADGVSIAFWTFGEGMPLVQMPSSMVNPTRRAWQTEAGRRWYEGLARNRRLIRYDNRGFGDSQRNITDYPQDSELRDLEAVVDHLGLERFAIFGYIFSGPWAITYAARHPERVSHLILWCTSARGAELFSSSSVTGQALAGLREANWELYIETMALTAFGWEAADQARQYAQALKESMTPEAMRAIQGLVPCDATDLLPQVRSPTLVLHRRQVRAPTLDTARSLAARIPDARLAILEGDVAVPYAGDAEQVLEVIDEFLGESPKAEPGGAPEPGGLVTILFTDMESSTALRQRLGDARAQELLRAHNTIVRQALQAHGGAEIKHTGDGIMASFVSAARALECAVAIQRAVADYLAAHPGAPLGVYIGLNAGEPIAEERDLFGTSVDLARRICDKAEPGEILVSNVVRELAAGKGFLFSDRGEAPLRGFEDPVRLYEVRWREET